jgi:enterochelin esterase-like enzyme
MLEPQSTFLFVLLTIAFGGLMWWMVATRRFPVRITAAVVAFAVAMMVGIMAVNKYFDYYQTWGAAITDLTGPVQAGPQLPSSKVLTGVGRKSAAGQGGANIYLNIARTQGYLLPIKLAGPASHITREGYVYLPPQYFQPKFSTYKFPVIELIHGQPGVPQDWIDVVGVTETLDTLVARGLAKPVVLVMPDANGGQRISEQCLNQVGGQQDMTYLALDVPYDIVHAGLRVQPPGPAWGLAGYSEGGFCAANMALHFPRTYGYAGVMSGYFRPMRNQMPSGALVNPFGGSTRLREANTPTAEVQALRPGADIPKFWVGAGQADGPDVAAAEEFVQLLGLHQADVPIDISPGGHTMGAWRAETPQLLEWMTRLLAQAVATQRHALPVSKPCRTTPASGHVVDSRTPGAKPSPRVSPSPEPSQSCPTSGLRKR